MSFLFLNKTLQLNNFKIRTTMNAKMSVFVICFEAITYFLLYNLHDSTFNCRGLILKVPLKRYFWNLPPFKRSTYFYVTVTWDFELWRFYLWNKFYEKLKPYFKKWSTTFYLKVLRLKAQHFHAKLTCQKPWK